MQPDYHIPDASTAVGALHTIAHKIAADVLMADKCAPATEVGSEFAHVKFACSSVNADTERLGSPFWKYLSDLSADANSEVSQRLLCLLVESPDARATDRLREFAKDKESRMTRRYAMKPNGSILRLDEDIAETAIAVRNEAAKILQGRFATIRVMKEDPLSSFEFVRTKALVLQVEKIMGDHGFFQHCMDGTPVSEWVLHDRL